MHNYWSQYSYDELMSMQGIEINEENDTDLDQDDPDTNMDLDDHPCCGGRGCDYCL